MSKDPESPSIRFSAERFDLHFEQNLKIVNAIYLGRYFVISSTRVFKIGLLDSRQVW